MPHTTIVLFGGPSDERHVSVASAQNIVRTLGSAALAWFWAPDGSVYDVNTNDLLGHQRPFELDFVPSRPAIFPDMEQALDTMPVDNPVFLLALHGTGGEDGTLQELLERRGIPFTGSGAAASAAAFDKERAKEMVRGSVRVAESRVTRAASQVREVIDDMLSRHDKIVLKPLAGGSSRGLFFLDRDGDVDGVAEQVMARGVPSIIEQFLRGRELTCGVLDQGSGPFALPVIEIEVDPNRAFDYEGKYLGSGTREICPAQIPEEMARDAQETALNAHLALGCAGYSRTDLMATEEGVFFLETNTLPGMTTSSLVPQELRVVDIEFRDFLQGQLELAVQAATAAA
ncbi:MAG TPA: ATP-grasp domain-containing protein [Thermoanaerobaculia bacterium]|nr:ATP-grasp domain-containing protein [Thermoanaerobaculia bacterium]